MTTSPDERNWLAELDVPPVINAAATLTRLGGSLMAPSVVAAMAAGAEHFVELPALQRAVGRRIAELTRNEAAFVSSGAAGGIMVAVAACLAGTNAARIARFPSLEEFEQTEVVIQRAQRNSYDYAAIQTGARIVEIDGTAEALQAGIGPQTGAVLWFAGSHLAEGALPAQQVIEIAHGRRIPVIIDAAAQIPSVANFWHFTQELGADLVIFSGGKGIRGPQPTGLVLGRADLIEGCYANGSPNYAIGRPLKVGKEELLGILAAVEWTLAQDEEATIAGYEEIVQFWIAELSGLPGVTIQRGFPSEAGQPHSRALISLDASAAMDRDEVIADLWARNPRIAVGEYGSDGIALNPQTLLPGEHAIVLEAVRSVLST